MLLLSETSSVRGLSGIVDGSASFLGHRPSWARNHGHTPQAEPEQRACEALMTTHQTDLLNLRETRRATPTSREDGPLSVEGWELLERVAEGAYSDVYRARPADRCSPLPAAYAVKVLREPWCDRPEITELLRCEARVACEVCNPHLISVLAASTVNKPHFLVSPWLNGQTLSRILDSDRGIDLPSALWIARQTAEALHALETAGWMHGDVKPGNLIVSPEAHVTLIDLGFARPLGKGGSAVDRPIMGTYQYIAPEMVTSRLATDIRSDIYSLGVVLFQMLAARLPFEGQTLADLAEQHRIWRSPDLRQLVPTLPGGLTRLVREMLSKNPWRRPRHAQEVIERLTDLEIASFGQRWIG